MLNFWQDKVESDEKHQKQYAFPDMVKHLMIEYQEYLFILQKVLKVLDPRAKVQFRKNQTASAVPLRTTQPTGGSGPGTPTKNDDQVNMSMTKIQTNKSNISGTQEQLLSSPRDSQSEQLWEKLELPDAETLADINTFLSHYISHSFSV